MTSKHEYTCINCPLSCSLELSEQEGKVLEVTGQSCNVGRKYAEQEFTDARRVVTTTVAVQDGTLRLLPVRTVGPIPKRLVIEAARTLADVIVEAPVKVGEVVLKDILGTGVDVIASRDLQRMR